MGDIVPDKSARSRFDILMLLGFIGLMLLWAAALDYGWI